MSNAQIRQAIRDKYAWPGGYPMYLVTNDGAALCMKCSRKEYRNIAWARLHKCNDGWFVFAAEINWDDSQLYCDHCSGRIESAYAEDEAEN